MCQYSTWYYLNTITGEVRSFHCGSWLCEDHRGLVAYHWATRVAGARPERMITLTNIPKDKTRAYLAFKHLVENFRRDGYAFEYCRFLEVGTRTGMYHFHLAQKGDFIPKHYLSERCVANGLGKITDIRRCKGLGPAWYMAKYITKEGAPQGWRKVAYSRGFFQGEPEFESEPGWVLVKPACLPV